ncbi:unnamed protein product [Blepharisma stoltei]|uniref:Uncharacterized protein n=1 Tax=Blepharisma stoltei TaxID=1481888 RepID=A0AAU9IVZ8_9CILI|nr:unnamed protein product [Blepharisma stoltei]
MGCGISREKCPAKFNKGDESETSLRSINFNTRMPSINIKPPISDQNLEFFGLNNHYEYNIKGTNYQIIISCMN